MNVKSNLSVGSNGSLEHLFYGHKNGLELAVLLSIFCRNLFV
jgi:hypothetical protein